MKLELEQIARWTGAASWPEEGAAEHPVVTGYSIDSRTIAPGELFFAIRGDRFDGHDFLAGAFERGAFAAVVAQSSADALSAEMRRKPLVVVEDPLVALQTLAAAVRRYWGRRLIGITGSAGKTTTKDAITAVLSQRYQVLKSHGNLNNHFGLPLQLLKLESHHEIAVVEMGMSNRGEIAALAKIAAPDWGVVTNVGNAHAENFPDGIAGIARAKYELVESLPAHGVAFLNIDDAYVGQFGRDFHGRAVYFGQGPCADPRAEDVIELGAEGSSFTVRVGERHAAVRLPLLGLHNITNAMAALAVGLEAGVPLPECIAALQGLKAGDKRGEILRWHGASVINDSYNSNPEALKSMIHTLQTVPGGRKILVAGEMLELGPQGGALHRECGREAAKAGIDLVLGVRGEARQIVEGALESGGTAFFLETPEEAGSWLQRELRPGDVALIKGSRGVRLERALEQLHD